MTGSGTPERLPRGGLYRLVHARHGRFLANPRDIYIGRALIEFGEYSEQEMAVLRQLVAPGAVVAEIGANIGAHTVPLAARVGAEGRVHAIEAQPIVFQALCANVALNGLLNVLTYHEASGSCEGALWFPDLNYLEPGNFGGISLGALPSSKTGRHVDVRPFDRLGLGRLDLLKIDVEGAELEVLQGAAKTIERCQPIIYVENDRLENSPALIDHIIGLGYRLWWHLPPLFNPDNKAGILANPWPGVVSCNMLCIPKGKPSFIRGLREVEDSRYHPLATISY